MLADGAVGENATEFTPNNYIRVGADGTLEERTPSQARSDIGAGTGSVSSVAVADATGITWTGSPITGSGTLTPALSANLQAWHGLATAAKQDTDGTLTALAAYNTNGLLTQTAADTFTGRTITGTSGRITVTNGNGVSGNPTIDIPTTLVDGGTYTPTTTALTNCSATAIQGTTAQYMRVGNTVTVSGQVRITATAAAFAVCEARVSLPVATALTANSNQIAGVANATQAAGTAQIPGVVYANTTFDEAVVRFNAPDTNPHDFWFHFTYQVV